MLNILKADLVSIHSSEENFFLEELSNENSFWLGGKDNRSLWEDGTRFDYENWSPDHQTRPGDCLEMTSGIWKNRDCNICHEKVFFSCKTNSSEPKAKVSKTKALPQVQEVVNRTQNITEDISPPTIDTALPSPPRRNNFFCLIINIFKDVPYCY